MKKQQTATVADIFACALDACAPPVGSAVGIALSGGLDSAALLHLAHAWAQGRSVTLHAFHVHHGLSPNADAWLAHCEQTCADLGVPFEARRVTLEKNAKTGTEEAARKRRYAALGELCAVHGVRLLLTAHHQDDQAETVLLQLLRGSGTAGLSGMDGANSAPELLGNPDLVMARPLLSVARKELEAYVGQHGVAHIYDESNDDPRFARNALRHQVMPVLAQAFPGFQERFARSAQHAQSAQRLLAELATQDLAACLDDDCITLATLRELSADRCYNLLRHWFGTRGLRMPSTAWLAQMLAQLLEARPDAQLLVTHPQCHVRRHRDRLYLTPKLDDLAGMRDKSDANIPGLEKASQQFTWRGEASLAFPAYGGVLHFDVLAAGEQGIDIAWLQAQTLTIDFRQGGERLKLALNRPTKSLKYHYQAFGVPAWERERLPLVCAAQQLLYAAGIGLDCHCLSLLERPRVALRWLPC
ncbi:tRNA lysidine(34) synthetase TilS [Janthinobacterium sp. LB2P10]|uniref:tRNA lysidine(34) synthetase TilS n=1 Tax=Janthinobacterium sp. LB2P10 TaxID=3424194 RepID=UPI003F1F26D1